jgi:hypothetical protein
MTDHPLLPGTRVYHLGQRWSEALDGTATVISAEEQRTGGWEYLVQCDQPLYEGHPNEPLHWASYHTAKAMEVHGGGWEVLGEDRSE